MGASYRVARTAGVKVQNNGMLVLLKNKNPRTYFKRSGLGKNKLKLVVRWFTLVSEDQLSVETIEQYNAVCSNFICKNFF